ncbi:MAG: hypothetical protein JSV64_00825 [Candidatus Bathyarchaeota archaeon]|jgi:hypothetical protein|nr:MAG: hypothetical protein JSV64_00825 [Candidatus Bathyarchaeota archaeon]
MGGPSEREYRKKLDKVMNRLNKRTKDVRDDVRKIEKIKVEALKKVEEMSRNIDSDLVKFEANIARSKDLAPESKQRLSSEIARVRLEVESTYGKLRRQVAESMIPVLA